MSHVLNDHMMIYRCKLRHNEHFLEIKFFFFYYFIFMKYNNQNNKQFRKIFTPLEMLVYVSNRTLPKEKTIFFFIAKHGSKFS